MSKSDFRTQKNVFISWSGRTSHGVATLLFSWLPRFIQSINPFLSSEDIRKGVRWFSEISGELEQINFGIVCITSDNTNAPWLLFEGGALSKSLGQSRVAPLLINVSNSDLQGPLAQFNTTSLTKEDIKKLLESINLHLGEKGISSELLDQTFDILWPVFEKQLKEALENTELSAAVQSSRSQADVLDEVLQLTRNITQQISTQRMDRVDSFSRLGQSNDKEKERGLLDSISHELLASIVGIRSNASFLQKRMHELPGPLVETKLNDILTDCELLRLHVDELRYILGHAPPPSKAETVLVFSEVILKAINQLEPLLKERGFCVEQIKYDSQHFDRVRIVADKVRLQQVVYNVLVNAIKYAEDNPANFQVKVVIEESDTKFSIRFRDWGIGITSGTEQQIFEPGFRSPEARGKNVSGGGLGLAIAQRLVREIGGDLILSNNYKPTEFQIMLVKVPKETVETLASRSFQNN